MSARFMHYDYLPLDDPKQSPLRRKVFHLDQIGRAEVIAAMAHARTWISADCFRRVPQEIRTNQFTFDENRTGLGSPADHIGILIGYRRKLI